MAMGAGNKAWNKAQRMGSVCAAYAQRAHLIDMRQDSIWWRENRPERDAPEADARVCTRDISVHIDLKQDDAWKRWNDSLSHAEHTRMAT